MKLELLAFKEGSVANINVSIEKKIFKNIDTVSLYLSPVNQVSFYYIRSGFKPRKGNF